MRKFVNYSNIDIDQINFSLGVDRSGKPQINMHIGPTASEVAFVTPACVTNWPRVSGDGNYGTMWGPTDVSKAKFTLDLNDAPINGDSNESFNTLSTIIAAIDDRLLDFVQNNQLRILGRKNLNKEECKMLQIRSVRPKYDKVSGSLIGHSVQMSTSKYGWDGMGGRRERSINVCDKNGAVIPDGTVQPGDVVASTMYANQVYTGVGGDKFGIQWSFEDVQVVCQRSRLEKKTCVNAFVDNTYPFAEEYVAPCAPPVFDTAQFSEPMEVR